MARAVDGLVHGHDAEHWYIQYTAGLATTRALLRIIKDVRSTLKRADKNYLVKEAEIAWKAMKDT